MDHAEARLDPRILRTRRLLRDAFVELLEEMEVEKISVNRIATCATINRVTFYLHYRDIPDMMDKLADEMIEGINRILSHTHINGDSEEKVEWPMMVDLLEHIAENAKFYKGVLASRRTTIFRDRLLNLLSQWIIAKMEKEGDDDSFIAITGIKKDIALWYGSAALIGTIVGWLRNDMPYTPRYLAKQLTLLLPRYEKQK